MSEGEEKIELANNLIRSGDVKKGADMLTEVFHASKNNSTRLNLAHSLSTILSPIEDRDALEKICTVGTSLAHNLGDMRLKAYFMSKKANVLMLDLTREVYALQNLKLAPDWIGFALLSEKNEYEKLEKSIKAKEKEVNKLSRRSVEIVEDGLDQNAIGHVYMLQGDVESSKCLLEKSRNLSRSKLFMFLHRWNLGDYSYKRKIKKMFNKHIDNSKQNFLKAVEAFRKANNDLYTGYAYYNLSNCLSTAGRFRQAKKYLSKAKEIATKHSETMLLVSIKKMEERIKQKNQQQK